VGENVILILEYPDGIHAGGFGRQGLQNCAEASQAISHGQVMLNVFPGVDISGWL